MNPQLHNDDCNIEKERIAEIMLTPFANIGQWWRNGETKPQHGTDAFTYGIWMYPEK